MNHAENGVAQLDNAIINFPHMIPDTIDLTAFMSEEQTHRVKSAGAYKDKLLALLDSKGEKGAKSPWETMNKGFIFRESELTIWSGYKGHGKSLVISQAIENFIQNSQKVFIISPEFPAHRVLHRMLIQGFGIHNQTRDLAERWIDAVNDNLWLYDQQSSLKPSDVPALCRYAVERLGVDHILIDSLMKCGVNTDKGWDGQKTFVDSIQQVVHRSKVHIHLVAHGKKASGGDEKIGGLHDIKGASEIADMAENVIIVWRNKAKEMGGSTQAAPDCIVKVEAQRNGDGWIGMIPLYFKKSTLTFHEGGA